MKRVLALTLALVGCSVAVARADEPGPVIDVEPSPSPSPDRGAPVDRGVPVREAPYARLAADLGTPVLVRSIGTKDKSQLDLHFVPSGESYASWTKMTNASILKVSPSETQAALLGVISRLKARLVAARATIVTFDRTLSPKTGAYYHFTAGSRNEVGVVYSPASGFVSVLSVSETGDASGVAADARMLIKSAGIKP